MSSSNRSIQNYGRKLVSNPDLDQRILSSCGKTYYFKIMKGYKTVVGFMPLQSFLRSFFTL